MHRGVDGDRLHREGPGIEHRPDAPVGGRHAGLEQRVVVVHFDNEGTLRDVRRYTLEDGMVVDPVTRRTPSPGKELTFLEQLLGNVGKFNRMPGQRAN